MEIIRSFLIILLVFLLSAISGPFGVLMLQWMKPSKILLFYGSILMYCVFAFSVVSTGFLLKLKREDLSSNIKNIGFNR